MKTERIFLVLIVIGLTFKYLLHWHGANVILIVTISSLSILYMFVAFYIFPYKATNNQVWGLSIPAGLCFSIVLNGILFRLLYWSGGQVMLLAGLIGAVIITILSFVLHKNDSHDNTAPSSLNMYYKHMQARSVIITTCALLLYFTPVSTLIAIQHSNDPEMVRLKTRSFENPENKEYKREYKEYLQKKEKE